MHLKHGVAIAIRGLEPLRHLMARIRSRDLYEAEELLEEIASWPDDRIKRLPEFYREKAREYRRLANGGEG